MEILFIFFLILLNGIFSMSEIALVSARKFKLEAALKRGNKNAKKALELAGNPNTFLSTVQIGITLIGILTGIYSGEQITEDVNNFVVKIPVLVDYAHSVSVVIVLIVLTFFSIVLGELIPKRIGLMFPETIAMLVATPMTYLSVLTKPFIWLLTKTNDLFLGIFGLKNNKDGIVSEEEIKAIVQESAESGEIQQIEQHIVQRVFALGDRKVSGLMTHRNDLVWFDVKDSLDTVKDKAKGNIHSVYPVADAQLDNLLGVVSLKDLFPYNFSRVEFDLKNFIKRPLYVDENTPAYKVLEQFKQNKFHYAMVMDEYGAFQGMTAMDDIVDALIGDATEYNQEEYQIIKRDDHSWLADGQYSYYEFLNYFGLTADENTAKEFNTLAGFLIHLLRHIPSAGEKAVWMEYEFEVIDMDERRIDKILITRKGAQDE